MPVNGTVMGNAGLARLGLAGRRVELRSEGASLHLRGTEGGAVEFPAAAVERLRLGVLSIRANSARNVTVYVAHLVPQGARAPLVLQVGERDASGYGEAMRRFAAAMAATHGLQSVETGLPSGAPIALAITIVAGMITAASLLMAVSLWSWGSGSGAVLFAVTALGAAGAAYRFRRRFGSGGPRPVASLDEIEAMLPRA